MCIIKRRKWLDYPIAQQVINIVKKWGVKHNKTKYGANLNFWNHTKETFHWDTEDDLDGLIEPDLVSHTELAAKLPGLLLEKYTPGPVSPIDIETLDPKNIDAAAVDNSGITNNTGVYDDTDTPTPIFTINPTPDTEPDNKHKGSEDGDEDNYDENEKVEEVEPPKEDTLDLISIESDDKDSDEREIIAEEKEYMSK